MNNTLSAPAVVAVRILRLAGITRREDARAVLLGWVKPPKLSANDFAAILQTFPESNHGDLS